MPPLAVSRKKTLKASKNKLLIVIIILIGMANSKLDACSCDTISFKDAIEYADEIFVGKITKVERFENGKFVNADHREEANWDWRYYFEIENKWKGNNKSKLIVHHQGTSCDLFFDIYEREYLVYASRKSGKENLLGVTIGPNNGKDKLTTWLCSRTIHNHYWEEENWFKDDIDKLNKEFPTEIELSKFQINTNLMIAIGLGMIGIVSLIIRKRINRKKKPTANNA